MKKSLLLILIIAAAAVGYASYKPLAGFFHKPAAENPGRAENPAGDKPNSIAIDTTVNQAKDAPGIHSILGKSNQLTSKQVSDMQLWRTDKVKFAGNNPGRVFVNGFTSDKKVSLTFDDGPDAVNTGKIVDILTQHQVKGSFFFKGSRLEEQRNVVEIADQKGHLVLSHAWSHSQLIKQSPRQIASELQMTEDKLFEIIGKRPALIRPPFGDIDAQVVESISRNGVTAVLWSIDTLDWSQKEPENIVKNVMDNVRPGDIILMHSDEDKSATVEALPTIITELQKKGYRMVDLGELLEIRPYK